MQSIWEAWSLSLWRLKRSEGLSSCAFILKVMGARKVLNEETTRDGLKCRLSRCEQTCESEASGAQQR